MATVEILQTEIVRALEAMVWTFNPYLDDPYRIHDYPWIVELIDSYNSITSLLPEEMQLQYPLVSID